jgi:oxygen-dependent protoporphyrinogen oxidase
MSAAGEQSLRVAVVGGGIAGLAAAEALAAGGHRAEIFEAAARLGGRMAPERLGAREVFLGGKNVGHRYRRFRELLARRGQPAYEAFGPDSAQLVRGRPRKLSFRSPAMRARLGARVLLRGQVRGGARFMRLAGRVRADADCAHLGSHYFAELALQSGDPTLPEYLGSALCRDVVRHITVRMNGAEPDECFAGNFGSNLGLVVDRFDQLRGEALGEWIRAVAAAHDVHTGAPVTALTTRGGRVAGLVVAGEERRFDAVVLALPAHEAARVIGPDEPHLASLLGTVRYFGVGVVVAEYDRAAFPQGFAALTAPAGMSLSNAGSYGLGDRQIVRYTFSGRAARDRIEPGGFDPEELLGEAEAFLAPHTPIGGARRLGFAARAFEPGLCAYRRDHATFLREARARLGSLAGLALAGDYMRGASLEACVRSGEEAAEQVVARSSRPAAATPLAVGNQSEAG